MAHNIYDMSDKRYSDLKKSICNNQDVEKLVKKAVMITGKKEKEIRNLVLKAMIQIEAQTGNPALEVYAKAVKNSTPLFDSTSQTNKERAEAIALRWIINYSMEESFDLRLTRNIVDAANNKGIVVSKKNEFLEKCARNKK